MILEQIKNEELNLVDLYKQDDELAVNDLCDYLSIFLDDFIADISIDNDDFDDLNECVRELVNSLSLKVKLHINAIRNSRGVGDFDDAYYLDNDFSDEEKLIVDKFNAASFEHNELNYVFISVFRNILSKHTNSVLSNSYAVMLYDLHLLCFSYLART